MGNLYIAKEVIEDRIESILTTKVDLSAYMSADNSLVENPGMKKIINVYKVSGNVQDLAEGVGNSSDIETVYESKEYTVGVTQGRSKYYDEQYMKNPIILEDLINGQAETMINDFTSKAIKEFEHGSLEVETDWDSSSSGYLFGKFVDAVANFGEEEEGLFCLISPANLKYLRKQLGDSLQYSEGFVRTGYVGSVCGVPVIVSKAVPDTCAFVANKEAVTLFLKKGVEVELDRNANTRENLMYIRKVALVALTKANKCCIMAEAQSTACATTTYTKAQKTIAGTCGTNVTEVRVKHASGTTVKYYDATVSNGSWTLTADSNLTAGDKIDATAFAPGYTRKNATQVTVAS